MSADSTLTPGPAPADAAAAPPPDPGTLIASKNYGTLLVLAALIGIVVSLAAWCFLELIYELQTWVYQDLPGELVFSSVPTGGRCRSSA